VSNTFENNAISKKTTSLDISPKFSAYSGVEITVDEDTIIAWPEDYNQRHIGRVLEFENPWGTLEQAQNIYDSLTSTGFQYQPLTASGAILSPAAEIGDGLTVNGVYSGIYKLEKKFTPLMAADVEAPEDAEIDHEFPYESKQDRIYKREIAEASAAISLTSSQIAAEVTRATTAEEELASSLALTATGIRAEVLSKSGGDSSSFGWNLTDSSWSVYSDGSEVFRIDGDGATVNGIITATGGTIGGFTIGSSEIYNGMNNIDSSENGVYMGTSGFAAGGGAFKVTSGGTMTLRGNINFQNSDGTYAGSLSAADLRTGAAQAAANYGTWTTGSNFGISYNAATISGNAGPAIFNAGAIYLTNLYKKVQYGQTQFDYLAHEHSFAESNGRIYIGAPAPGNGNHFFNIASTQTYRNGVGAVNVSSVTVSSSPTTIYPNRVKVDITLTNGNSATYYRSP